MTSRGPQSDFLMGRVKPQIASQRFETLKRASYLVSEQTTLYGGGGSESMWLYVHVSCNKCNISCSGHQLCLNVAAKFSPSTCVVPAICPAVWLLNLAYGISQITDFLLFVLSCMCVTHYVTPLNTSHHQQ